MDRFFRLLAVVCLLAGFVLLVPQTAFAGGEVTDCKQDDEFQKRLAAGGSIGFNCGQAVLPLSAAQVINEDTTIDGEGMITLSGQDSHRLFVVSVGKTLTLRNITLVDGFVEDDGGAIINYGNLILESVTIQGSRVPSGYNGGAIASYGVLTMTGSTLRANVAGNGGALYLRTESSSALLAGSFLEDNRTSNPIDGLGGAILLAGGADLVVQGGEISGNLARAGGAVFARSPGSVITIRDGTRLRGNQANYGGGLYIADAVLDISGIILQENRATYSGGGGYLESAWTVIDRAVFLRNRAQQAGYQAYGSGGGLAVRGSAGSLSLTRSTLEENVGFYGGGIYLDKTTRISLVANRLSGNEARAAGGGLYLEPGSTLSVTASLLDNNHAAGNGGGAYIDSGADLMMENVTLSGNQAQVTGGGLVNYGRLVLRYGTLYGNAAPAASHIYYSTIDGALEASLTLTNTVLAGAMGGPNCFLGKPVDSATYSLSSDGSCGFTGLGDSNDSPLAFGPLSNNGGPTLTHLPLPGSPAIDGGQCLPGVVTDQRGESRLAVGAGCDIGAAEVVWANQVYMPLISGGNGR